MDQAITFPCAGEQLVGVISSPDTTAELGVLVIVGGPQYRAGSHRQFLLFARRLAEAGIPVMRFDYRGMGDSSGAVQTFEDTVPDIAAAMDAFGAGHPGLERVVLWGLCDGASACLTYWHATRDARVAGMVLLNPWILSEETFARTQIKHHYRRLLHRDFWMKLARGEFDIAGAVRWLAGRLVAAARPGTAGKPAELPFQDRMSAALEKFAGPVLLVLSGGDLTATGFLEYCESDRRLRELIRRPNVEQAHLPAADHTFSSTAVRQELERLNLEWLGRSFS